MQEEDRAVRKRSGRVKEEEQLRPEEAQKRQDENRAVRKRSS
jgi:hypothetical protein